VQVAEEAGSMEEAGSGHEDSSHNILTLDALQVLSRSQVTPELSMSMDNGRYVKKSTYIHTPCSSIHPCQLPLFERFTRIALQSTCLRHFVGAN
jgi:hypothetical protein